MLERKKLKNFSKENDRIIFKKKMFFTQPFIKEVRLIYVETKTIDQHWFYFPLQVPEKISTLLRLFGDLSLPRVLFRFFYNLIFH